MVSVQRASCRSRAAVGAPHITALPPSTSRCTEWPVSSGTEVSNRHLPTCSLNRPGEVWIADLRTLWLDCSVPPEPTNSNCLALLWHVRTDRQRPQNFVPTPDARRFFLCACPGLWRRHSRRRGANGGTAVRKTSRFVHVLPVGVVAQLVERLVRNEKVAGSIPVGSTTGREAQSPMFPSFFG